MGLTTITFATLRERNSRSLERAETPAESADVTHLSSRQRRRIGILLEKRAHIEDLASTQNQREAYGVGPWHGDFVRMRDLHGYPGADAEGEALRARVWESIPNSRFKRFQELFCHPHQRIVPAFDIDGDNNITFRASPNFNTLSLQGCLVSPDLIADDLARDLRLCAFTDDDDRHPERRLQKKHAAVPRLKKLWESSVSLQPNHHRVLVVSPPTPEIDAAYGEHVSGPDLQALGSILYVREEDQEDGEPRKLLVQHFDSAYGAHRKTLHEAHVHEREINQLEKLQVSLLSMNRRLDREWKEPERRDGLRAECRALFDACIAALERCTNKYKVEAHGFVDDARELRDSRGRENITATMTRMVAVVKRFHRRYGEMFPKGGFNQQDRMALQRHIKGQETALCQFRQSIEHGASVIGNGSVALFGEKSMSADVVRSNVRGIQQRMEIDPHVIRNVTVQPLLFYAAALHDGYLDLEAALLARDQRMAKDTVLRMHVLGKFQEIRSRCERLKADFVDADRISLSAIHVFVDNLQKIFNTFQVFPNEIVEDYREPFEDLQRGLADLQRQIDAYAGQDAEVGQRTEIARTLKEYLDSFDIEGQALALLNK